MSLYSYRVLQRKRLGIDSLHIFGMLKLFQENLCEAFSRVPVVSFRGTGQIKGDTEALERLRLIITAADTVV